MDTQIKTPKYIFVVGGVMSSVGKGVAAGSISAMLQARGLTATNVKCDMYVNIDAGTIRPTEHGEVFVGTDGIESDQDLGNYERFAGSTMTSLNYITTGQVYQEVIRRERNLEYDGEDVEVVPDVPNEIIRRIRLAQQEKNSEVTVVEFGGTVGEYQLLLFLEAARMLKLDQPGDVAVVLVSYLPLPKHIGEMKTKPTQYAIRSLNSAGLQADFIIARGEKALDQRRRDILARVCNMPSDRVIAAPDVESIYSVPELFHEQGLDDKLLSFFGCEARKNDYSIWKDLSARRASCTAPLKIAVVGKYFNTGDYTLSDSYISVIEAIKHAAWTQGKKPELVWLDAEKFNNDTALLELNGFDGVIVPGGFGTRGVEAIIRVIEYVRMNNIPFLGICYGMQLACVEFARNVVGISGAHTIEVDENALDPVIHGNPHQLNNIRENRYGGTMRLGSFDAQLLRSSRAYRAYGTDFISERHRHRYEFNNAYKAQLEAAGLICSGVNPETGLVEIVELELHPFFVGTQFHPEFTSSPMKPNPLFVAFAQAACERVSVGISKVQVSQQPQV